MSEPIWDDGEPNPEAYVEDDLYCEECDSELDPEGVCCNELCAYYERPREGGEDDRLLRQEERRMMGIE